MWENALEKLKILNYENEFCGDKGRKPFSRIHFVFPAKNLSTQFDEFMDICGWLCTVCSSNPEMFKRDPYDDPNTVANKLMLALRQLDCRLSFPAQKLRTAHGEAPCSVLEFLTDKALATKNFRWAQPIYADPDVVELAEDNVDASLDDIEDEVDGGGVDDDVFQEDARLEMSEVSMELSSRQIHTSQVMNCDMS
jgi:intraflagellar transport protein 57